MDYRTAISTLENHLNHMYTTILKNSIFKVYAEDEKEKNHVRSIVILFPLLSAYSLSSLLHVTENNIDQTLADLHSSSMFKKTNQICCIYIIRFSFFSLAFFFIRLLA